MPAVPRRVPRLQWHVIYYLLAAFDIFTVSASLYLNLRITDMYVHAVASGQDWAQLLADASALEDLIGVINSTGNDVFDSNDPEREVSRLAPARASAQERIAALRNDLRATLTSEQAPVVLGQLAEVERRMGVMAEGAQHVLAVYKSGQREEAARRMALMDREYKLLLAAMRELRLRFAEARRPRPVAAPPLADEAVSERARWERFELQTQNAAELQRWEFLLGVLIVFMVLAAVFYGRKIAAFMKQDAAEKARTLEDLREAREGLEKRVLERTEELQASQEALRREETLAAMGSLVGGVAHEVRNPLFGLAGTIEVFEERFKDNETARRYLAVMRRDVGRLQALMRDLLELGKPVVLDRVSVSLESIFQEALRACEPLATGLLVSQDVPDDLPPVFADRPRVVQVFQNLVQNAIQHSPAGGKVILEARPDGPGSVCCTVRDVGPGFAPEDLRRLFEPFYTRRKGGTGLGLSIAQRIVEQHGGRIEAGNHPEGGAVVTVILPAAA
jgi:signal transduction histidine kinase